MSVPQTTLWLSILLPVYKVEPYIRACADSILAQADAGVELIFADDASPDGSAAIIETLQAAYPAQVHLIRHTTNQGISTTRNTLLDAARGDYLWFIDPDDLMEPGALARLQEVIAAHSPDLVMCNFRAFDDDGSPQRARYAHVPTFASQAPAASLATDTDLLLHGLFRHGQWHAWSKIVRHAAWPRELRFPEGRIFEDQAVFPRLALRIKRYVHVPEVWVAYRQRTGSALATLTAARLDDWMNALVGYGAELGRCSEETRFEIAHYCARTFMRAVRRSGKLGEARPADMLSRFAWQFEASSPLQPQALLSAYLKRGRLLRWLQLRHWLAKAS